MIGRCPSPTCRLHCIVCWPKLTSQPTSSVCFLTVWVQCEYRSAPLQYCDCIAPMSSSTSPRSAAPPHDRPPKRRRTSAAAHPLSCNICGRAYERPDHLNRHLDSRRSLCTNATSFANNQIHTSALTRTDRNERSFRCANCPAAFNRKDLLVRHQASHEKNAEGGGSSRERTSGRAARACGPCVSSKVKCDNGRPCKRCLRKRLACTERDKTHEHMAMRHTNEHQQHERFLLSSSEQATGPVKLTQTSSKQQLGAFPLVSHDQNMEVQEIPDLFDQSQTNGGAFDIPAFFEHIMVAGQDWMRSDYAQPPPDLTSWIPDGDWFDHTDLFGNDFTPTIDQTLQAQPVLPYDVLTPVNADSSASAGPETRIEEGAMRRRHIAFQHSPW